jgi:hypothetical protein
MDSMCLQFQEKFLVNLTINIRAQWDMDILEQIIKYYIIEWKFLPCEFLAVFVSKKLTK